MTYDFERNLEAKHTRRLKAEDRFLTRLEEKEAEALKLVGEVIRDGKPVFYINMRFSNGAFSGKTKEFSSPYEAVSYLIRNRYV